MITIIGIDPGSRFTGFGVIQTDGQHHRCLEWGTVRTEGEMPERLNQIFQGISAVINKLQPVEAAIEQVFMQKNVNSALKLGQARGAALVALSEYKLIIAEYSPRRIKQAVVGYGAADKTQIQHMVKLLLNLTKPPQVDAADALAVAICHAHSRRQKNLAQ